MKHEKDDKTLSFFEFLEKHYAVRDFADEDHSEDMKLPFKSTHSCSDITIKAPVFNPFTSLLIKPVDTNAKTYALYCDKFLPSSFLPNIWQPPKSC